MTADHVVDKRARLLASRSQWSDRAAVQPLIGPTAEKHHQDSIQWWVISLPEECAKAEVDQEGPGQHLKRNGSSEDDLALGVEASLYGKVTAKTVQEYLRSSAVRPPLPRWSSLTSAISNQSEPLSVMDVLNLWQDDPEEVLLDLGFGVEEPDITVRIPARFINNQSKARGIDIQLFLEAQKNRIDIENPDVRNRFRQLEVLHQVTTAFSSLVGASAQGADRPSEPTVSAETRERRRRVGMLLRKASKKTLSQMPSFQEQQPPSPPLVGPGTSPELPADPVLDRRSPLKRARQCPPDNTSLGPLAEERGSAPDRATPTTSPLSPEKSSNLRGGREFPSIASPITSMHKSRNPGEMAESFELEEIQSFDEGSLAGSSIGIPDPPGSGRVCLPQIGSGVVRTNSCQSDSSGFLEEPCIPAGLPPHSSGPGSDLMKVLSAISGDSTDSQQKSVDQQEIEFGSSDQQSPGVLLKPTESSRTDSHTDPVKEPAHNEQLLRQGDGADSPLWEGEQTNCLVDMDVVPKNIAHEDVGKSTKAQRDSASSAPAVVLEGDSQMEIPYSGHTALNIWPCSTHQDADLETDNVMRPSEEHTEVNNAGLSLGRSVSVQMPSGLASVSQSSLKKGMSHTLSLDHVPIVTTQPETELFSPDLGSYGAMGNHSDPTPRTSPPLPELPAPLPHSQERPEGTGGFRKHSVLLDGDLSYEEVGLSEGTLWAGSPCCCSCDHNCHCCCQNRARLKQTSDSPSQPRTAASLPYSLDELEDMMRCMRKFWRVLSEMEEKLEEEQASVLSSMSNAYRADVQEVLALRAAVKQEAGALERQLTDLSHAYHDNIKMKLNRLLDEQSHLCSQLSITPSDTPLTGHAPTRSVGIQCCLLPGPALSHGSTNDTNYIPDSGWSPNSKMDKLDFVGFIKSLKDVSIGNDSLE